MDKNKKLAYIILSIGFVMVVSGAFSSFMIGLKSDHEEVLNRMDDVSLEFESFSTNTTAFEDFRDELYNGVLDNIYYETMLLTDDIVKEKMSNYENLVDQLARSTKKMDSLCDNVYYPKSDINSMCMNYKSIYEQVVNYFVSDVKTYNSNVKKFNAYQDNNGSKEVVSSYKTSKKFIDYNGDGNFDGKEE